MWRFTAHLAHIATLTQHTTLYMNYCFMSCNIKHSNLQLPSDSSMAVAHIQRLIPAPRNNHTVNCLSYSPVAINFVWLWWSPTASEAILYGLNLKNFPGEHARTPPLEHCALYMCAKKEKKKKGKKTCRMAASTPTLCMPSPFNLWIRLCIG